MLKEKRIGMIGGGKMGGALMGGMISGGLVKAEALTVADKDEDRLGELVKAYGVTVTVDNREAVRHADVVILAVKPQNMADVLDELADAVMPSALVISIAAGIATAFIEERLGEGVRIVRVMPNMPALIGEGAAALCCGVSATKADLELARHIFGAVGITVEVKETLMDAVTGLSGSGPGYAFLIIEALTDAGIRMGLGREVALKLSAQSLFGAAKLCLLGKKPPAELRAMVTSPGGTTLAGLKALEEGRLRETLISAVEAATRRSAELGGSK
ncbi:MAG: pyrroline-5-carboxylate reductase [Pseudomonadota bacterium]|nr:pyrroline-5-carboxylate reductase [Pseudomonadota bacterium]MBU2026428.1 pyrroline-5-carboxylate reductase [Pseudomonadota bacterium]MBU2234219.1 pyrroline-5-carboxylate reductase [Pseudomonadota bacterium]